MKSKPDELKRFDTGDEQEEEQQEIPPVIPEDEGLGPLAD